MPASEEQQFAASYDLPAKICTVAVIAVCVVVCITTSSLVVGALELCVITLAYLNAPQSYKLSGRSILIKRFIGTVRIPLDNIRELRAGTAEDFRKCTRLWASGGLFGYYGLFKTARLGKCRWYVTNRSQSVIVVTGESTVVLSPNDVPGFLAAVRSEVFIPETTAALTEKVIDVRKGGVPLGVWIGGAAAILLTLGGLGFGCFAVMYSPGPPKLTLTSNSLTIRDLFYPVTLNATDIDLSGIRIVNIRTDHEWTPTERTNGFANAHYHSGWFQVAGGAARMYWADGATLVLLPSLHGGAPVLVEVSDPEQFVESVRRQWANR